MQFRINNQRPSPTQAIIGLLLLALVVVSMFVIARFIFTILAYLFPVLLIVALVLDYRTVTDYVKWVWGLLRNNTLVGVFALVFSVLGFPLLGAFLAGKAALMRSVRRAKAERDRQTQGEFVEYETLDSDTLDSEPLELPDRPETLRERRGRASSTDSYDRLFEE